MFCHVAVFALPRTEAGYRIQGRLAPIIHETRTNMDGQDRQDENQKARQRHKKTNIKNDETREVNEKSVAEISVRQSVQNDTQLTRRHKDTKGTRKHPNGGQPQGLPLRNQFGRGDEGSALSM